MVLIVLFWALCLTWWGAISYDAPKTRRFIPLLNPGWPKLLSAPPGTSLPPHHKDLRVLQFNMLADGLSALRDDLGDFR